MKSGFFIFVFLVFWGLASGQIDTVNGLVTYYPMNGNGDNALGTGNNLRNYGATLTTDRYGHPNSAYHFDGNTYLITNYSTTNFNAITFSAWIKTTVSNRYIVFIQSPYSFVGYVNRYSAGKLMVAMDANSWNNSTSDQSNTTVTTGEWIFVAATNDGKQTRIYVNGKFEKSYPEILTKANSQLEIGGGVDNSSDRFIGDIDDVKIYNRSLNDNEVKNIYSLKRDTSICNGSSYTINAGSEYNAWKKLWSTGDTGRSITVTNSGIYWVKLTQGNSVITDSINVTIYKSIIAGLKKDYFICPHDSVFIKINSAPDGNLFWQNPKKDAYGQPLIIKSNNFWAKDSGAYYLISGGNAVCKGILDTVHVSQALKPVAVAGPDTVLCSGQTYIMQGAGGVTYKWIPALYLSSDKDPHAIASPPDTQLYNLVVSNNAGCSDTSKVWLKVRPPLKIKAFCSDSSICFGSNINVYAKATGGVLNNYHFTWPNDKMSGDTITITGNTDGWHNVILDDGCSNRVSDSVFVKVTPKVKAGFNTFPSPALMNHHLIFNNTSQNAASYLWSFGNMNNQSKDPSPTYIFTKSGNEKIRLVAYGLNGCGSDTAYEDIIVESGNIVMFIPNAFTPGNDGLNDSFAIRGTGIKDYSCTIFNRWGELIYNKDLSDQKPSSFAVPGYGAWDGRFKGAFVPEGVYLYKIKVVDIDGGFHYYNGTFHVLR